MIAGVLKARRGGERTAAEKAVAQVCMRKPAGADSAAPVLVAMKELQPASRQIVLSVLGRVGGASALAVVEDAIASADAATHDAGLRALCNWPDATVESRLLELARTESRPGHRKMALRALIRIAPLPGPRSDDRRLDVLRTAIAMSQADSERLLVLDRARSIRTIESLQFVLRYMKQPALAERACLTIVELAHHRTLREPNKAEFDNALDQVIATTGNAEIVDRAQRYKRDETWVRPEAK